MSDDKGVVPVFLPEKSLVRYGLKLSEDIGDSVAFHFFDTSTIVEEIKNMGFMCDFHAIRERVFKWEKEQILCVRDDDAQFGENYFWAASDESIAKYGPAEAGAVGAAGEHVKTEEERLAREEEERRLEEEERRLLTYVPLDLNPRPWKSLGSEVEIDAQWRDDGYEYGSRHKHEHDGTGRRAQLRQQVMRQRRLFGQTKQLNDQEEKERQSVGCNRQIDKNYELKKMVLEGGFQSAMPRVDNHAQTTRNRLVNKVRQVPNW